MFLITVIPALCFVQDSCCCWLPTDSLEFSLKANRSLEDDFLFLSAPFVRSTEMGKKEFVHSASFAQNMLQNDVTDLISLGAFK